MFSITSSYTMNASLRGGIADLQSELARAQKELATGKRADPSVALGVRASFSVSLADAQEGVGALQATNSLVDARLASTQAALDSLVADARSMRTTLLAAQTDGGQREAIVAQARNALTQFVAKLNSGDGEGFFFGGINSDVPPIANYFAEPPAPNKAAVDAAFANAFGFDQADPAVASISQTQMRSFLTGAYDTLFSGAAWRGDWSGASDKPLTSRIGLSHVIDSSVTANEPGLKDVAAAYVMIADLGAANMSDETYHALLTGALERLDRGVGETTKTQARIGVMQNEIKTSSDMMTIQSDTIRIQLHDLESVDETDAAARVNGLMTQIETAYTLTARISQLSLAKYL
ncbi:flagellar hook-associated family protein [Methylocystis parvus]|uniref:Flagellin n=1 Tax=Methylocystis parvus TaxID=134 RepID=A0A6B8M6G7_9HYPH|nr:flagellar hook-associated family protein [Methylocystis parvus]QGM98006.1 flagellar hook-associated family protein [Methylocystis parvus]WBK01678.1 flagellar hook-associated family protein [Methylocystis parvus OBBP]